MMRVNSEVTENVERIDRFTLVKSNLLSYVALFKPWIIALVLVSTLGGLFVAGRGLPELSLILGTLIGISLATASAAALNNSIDADIDALMKRTSHRPTAAGAISSANALVCGLLLALASAIVMSATTNAVASSLTIASIFIYVVPYTYLLKRTTPLATYVGGIGGALPPVIGYAAVNPYLDVTALTLFMVIYAWQHPHFWSLALKYRDQYAKAGVQNLPVACGVDETKKQIVVWSVVLFPITLLPYIIGFAGVLFASVAAFLGILFISMSLWFYLSDRTEAMSLFFFSIVHLSTLFCLLIVDLV